MSFEKKGSTATTVTVSMEPDRSGNYVCNGTADDVEIQAAIDYVGTIGRGKVVVLEGNYDITATITLVDYLILDLTRAILTLANDVDDDILYFNGTIEQVFVFNGTLDGNKANNAAGNGIRFRSGSHYTGFVKIEGVRIINVEESGVALQRVGKSHIINCLVEDSDGSGFDVFCRDLMIEGCSSVNAGTYGFLISAYDASTRVTLVSCFAENSATNCFRLTGAAGDMFVLSGCHGITSSGPIFGFSFDDINRIVVQGCTAKDSSTDGFEIQGIHDMILTGCIAYQCDDYGFVVEASNGDVPDAVQFIGCHAEENGQHGLFIKASNVVVAGGVYLNNDQSAATSSGIEIAGTIGDPISDIIVNGARCYDNQGTKTQDYGISSNQYVSDCIISDNVLTGNDTGSLNLAGSPTAMHNLVDGVNTVGADVITAEISEIVENTNANIGRHPVAQMLDNVETTVRIGFSLPMDFYQIVTAQVVIVSAAAGDLRWDAFTDFGKLCTTEEYNEHSDTVGATTTGVLIDDMTCIDISAALTGVAAGDRVGMEFWRDGDNGLDTIDDVVYVLGIRVRYV